MKASKIVALFVLLFGGVYLAQASPLCLASGTFQDLLNSNALGGCTIDDKLFTDFAYSSSDTAGLPILASAFDYQVVNMGPSGIGFQFSFGMFAGPGEVNDVFIGYNVLGPNIVSDHLAVTGFATGTGLASVAETYCKGTPLGAGCPVGDSGTLEAYFSAFGNQPADSSSWLTPVRLLSITKDIEAAGGTAGIAHISGVLDTVDQTGVPEPVTLIIFGSGLTLLGSLGRLRRK